ncbi:DUF1904 domain-containing protein [Shewanella sp. Isolate7]|uniref:DUF1904 domain-containing protein n=1 Tax=Shewanella sp. Isolate7 TaxID=2908528 RepID=UPI001EFE89C2|nr:DUF1904 domain-containing protein [Shewanella sp. Isolate7]MCG9722756.1 DUF1904 domain-containing protein [Shewanella sp. Isolate7]
MPHIRMRGLPQEAVCRISETLLDELANLCQVKTDSFTLDWEPSVAFRHGELDKAFVQVEVLWFAKDPEIRHAVEQSIRQAVLAVYSPAKHISIMFMALTPQCYYRDGQHF